jgi:hypothetical protein
MQYDLNLLANQSQRVEATGTFFKYKSGTGLIRVYHGSGYIDLIPGQGMRGVHFNGLSVKDLSGANNPGVLLAGAFDFLDDNVTGEITVTDSGRSMVGKGIAYIGIQFNGDPYPAAWPATALQAALLTNPAGSGKNLVVHKLSTTLAGGAAPGVRLFLGAYVKFQANAMATPTNKKPGGPATVASTTYENYSVNQDWPTTKGAPLIGHIPFGVQLFEKPLIVPPGQTLLTLPARDSNSQVYTQFEYTEELV